VIGLTLLIALILTVVSMVIYFRSWLRGPNPGTA
jgi:hypothetical protein